MAEVRIPSAWKTLLGAEFEKTYFETLTKRVREEYLHGPVFPHPSRVFRAFELSEPNNIRVVILGQDPYHTPGVADGLAFSTLPGNPIPPSLQNIFKEIEREHGKSCNKSPDLTRWASQGVLLLNASLSVASGQANSHADFEWHEFTDAVIRVLSETQENIVFMLWGSFAGKKAAEIDFTKHAILTAPHPSPLSAHRGFLGCGHFAKANEDLTLHSRVKGDWCS